MPEKTLQDTNIAVKAGFTSMLVLMLIFGIFAIYQLRNISLTMTDTLATNSEKIVHVVLMRDSIRQRQVVMAEMLSMEDVFEREESRIIFFKLSGGFRDELKKLRKLPIDDSEKKLLQNILDHVPVAQAINRQAVSILMEDYTSAEGRQLIINAQVSQKEIYSLLGDLINLQNQNIQKSVKISKEKYATTLIFSILFGVVIALIAWIIARIMTKIVTAKNNELLIKNNKNNKKTKKTNKKKNKLNKKKIKKKDKDGGVPYSHKKNPKQTLFLRHAKQNVTKKTKTQTTETKIKQKQY